MAFLISPEQRPDWNFLPEEFSRLLREHWIVIHESYDTRFELRSTWKIRFGIREVDLWMYSDAIALHIDADRYRSIVLAFWYRTIVPDHIELNIYNDVGELDLHIDSKADEISSLFL